MIYTTEDDREVIIQEAEFENGLEIQLPINAFGKVTLNARDALFFARHLEIEAMKLLDIKVKQ